MDHLSLSIRTNAITTRRMTAVRETFRLRRLASTQHRLWFFYLEHNLLEQAVSARAELLALLGRACQQWRLVLGLA